MTLTFTPVLPPEPDLAKEPRRVGRTTAAKLVTRYYFPVSARALENWDLDWLTVNGKATCETEKLFTAAQAKLDAALRRMAAKEPPRPVDEPTNADLDEEVEAA